MSALDQLTPKNRRRLAYLNKLTDQAFVDYDGLITYGLKCQCGHQARVKLTPEQAATSRFTCRKCGRSQTRARAAD